MPYSDDNDLYNEFSTADLARLTGDPTGEVINVDRINHARQGADSLIDAYLYGRYDVPFEGEIDPVIRKISTDLTVANLYDYYMYSASIPSSVVWRKLNAVKLLKDLRDGYVTLVGVQAGTNAPPPIISSKSGVERKFDNEMLNQFD